VLIKREVKMLFTIKRFLLQNQSWFWTQLVAIVMGLMLIINPANWKLLTPYSGYLAVAFLVTTLSLNPIKALKPEWHFIKQLNRYRRMLGVASFSCAAVHLICFIIKRGSLKSTLPYLIHPALISVFWIAFPILFVLALTSNNYSVKYLGFKKWQKIHNMVYLAEAGIIIHMIMVDAAIWAVLIFAPLVSLQFTRYYLKKTKIKIQLYRKKT
jgi:sulfoxide reductase heme-binding subunit YedZ